MRQEKMQAIQTLTHQGSRSVCGATASTSPANSRNRFLGARLGASAAVIKRECLKANVHVGVAFTDGRVRARDAQAVAHPGFAREQHASRKPGETSLRVQV